MTNLAKIKEMFVSTQGEGPYIGYKQLFIRFCSCNLACKFCDTDFKPDKNIKEVSITDLLEFISREFNLSEIHSISYTGGEPLLHVEFLKDFLPLFKHTHYLETNATLENNLSQIINHINIISADIKLPSATGISGTFEKHDKFFQVARQNSNIELFAKVVFDENITEEEIREMTNLAKKHALLLILQPKTSIDGLLPPLYIIENIFDKCLKHHKNTRLIPQVHKFLDIK